MSDEELSAKEDVIDDPAEESSDFTSDDTPLYSAVSEDSMEEISPPRNRTTRLTPKQEDRDPKTPPKRKSPTKAPKKAATPRKVAKKDTQIDDESDFEDSVPLSDVFANILSKRKKTSQVGPDKKRQKKSAAERQEDEMPEFKWWLEEEQDSDAHWRTLEHNGLCFPPPYKPLPKNIKLKYDGKPIDLPEEAEEVACFYATHLNSQATRHTENPKFCKNFFTDFLDILNQDRKKKEEKHVIKKLDLCDFRDIAKYLEEQSEIKKSRSKEEKAEEKKLKKAQTEKFGFATLDGRREKIGNYMAEPPGLFLGRGAHPKIGKVKKRIQPRDVTLNLSEGAKVPPCPIEGQNWKEIVHDPAVAWLAFWRENVNGGFKYVRFAASSAINGKADREKFIVAARLKDRIDTIRENYLQGLVDDHEPTRQISTAIYLIDRLALRVGNEKGKDEADTVGCCSLRVEHITPEDPDILNFDFLGKDSMRYHNAVQVPKKVFVNIKRFQRRKEPEADLFHLLTTTKLNSYLKKLMPGLTAKVFRTYNASITLQEELAKMDPDTVTTLEEKVLFFNRANREVAILCNHQRSLPKSHGSQMEKIDSKIEDIKEQLKEVKEMYRLAKQGIEPPSPKRDDGESPRAKFPKDPAKLKKRIEMIRDSLQRWEIKKIEKEENKSVATSTSKINYIDPRITVAWCKKHNVDLSRIFSKTIRQKFPWAMDTEEDFKW